jgi:hypothetical protein
VNRLLSAGCKYSPHPYSLPLAFALALAFAATPARAQAQQTKRVWTTEDVNALSSAGLISIVGPQEETAPAPAAAPVEALVPQQGPIYDSRTEDPAWYADQAAQLQAQLDASMAALAQARDNLAQATNLSGVTGTVYLDQPSLGVTPEDVIANLEEQTRELQGQLDDLADLARRNDILPGVLREAT